MGKYDFDLDLIHSNSLLLILEQIKSDSVVLEFGPANGRLTKYLKNSLKCKVYLAELDEEAGKEALQYGEDLVVGDIENMEWFSHYRDIRFDYIICADILEHLRNPLEILVQAKLLLKPEGSFLLSVPNFAHNSVLINLLNNELDYREIGLLDNTHIHMFTKNSLEKMLSQAGLYPVKKMATYVPLDKTEIPIAPVWVNNPSVFFWRSREYGDVYQFIYEAKKENFTSDSCNFELKKISSTEKIQVFHDDGSGFNEDNCLIQNIYDYKVDNKVVIPLRPGESILRIDPMEQSGIVRLVSCQGLTETKSVDIEISDSNAILKEGKLYFFDTDDPQWQIQIPVLEEPIKKLEVVISYIAMMETSKIRLIAQASIDVCQRNENDRKHELASLEEVIQKKYEDEKAELEKKIKEQEETLSQSNKKLVDTEEKLRIAQSMAKDCLEDLRKIKEKNKALDEKNEENKRQPDIVNQNISNLQDHIRVLENMLEKKDSLIQDIYNSRTWRVSKTVQRLLGRKTE